MLRAQDNEKAHPTTRLILNLANAILSKSVTYILANARFRPVKNWTSGKIAFSFSNF
jgi:hypothetical protein